MNISEAKRIIVLDFSIFNGIYEREMYTVQKYKPARNVSPSASVDPNRQCLQGNLFPRIKNTSQRLHQCGPAMFHWLPLQRALFPGFLVGDSMVEAQLPRMASKWPDVRFE